MSTQQAGRPAPQWGRARPCPTYLAPAPLVKTVTATGALPVRSDPRRANARRPRPTASDPRVIVAAPAPVSIDPDITRSRSGAESFDANRRGRDVGVVDASRASDHRESRENQNEPISFHDNHLLLLGTRVRRE